MGLRACLAPAEQPNERATLPNATTGPNLASGSPTAAAPRTGTQGASATRPSPYIGADGNWKLSPGVPPPAIAPFDATKAKEHQEAWAKHLGLPVEETNSIGMKLILIPPGEFDMGSTAEEIAWAVAEDKKKHARKTEMELTQSAAPRHRVKITKPFFAGIYQVTQAEFEKVAGVNPSAFTEKQLSESAFNPPLAKEVASSRAAQLKRALCKDTSRHPVETVSWNEATEFCRRLSAMPAERAAGRAYRLPTEAEWEYACRAGTVTRWYFGDEKAGVDDAAWHYGNSGAMTHPVGEKRPNAWGLYDMCGNLAQFCADWFHKDYYKNSLSIDPAGPPAGFGRVTRGCSYYGSPVNIRSADRSSGEGRMPFNGFRVVAEITGKPLAGKGQ